MTDQKPRRGESGPSADEFALLVDAVDDYAIFLLSPEGIVRTWNPGAARIMGYSSNEILGEHFSRFYTDEDRERRKPWWELEVAVAEGRVEDEGWRVRADGHQFRVNTVITPVRDAAGTLIGFAKITRDLTERQLVEQRERENEELIRLLIDSVEDYAIFVLDADGRVATWNPGARRIKGYEADEIIGRHFSTFYPQEDITAGKPARELELARQHGAVEDEGWRLRKDGTRFWANVVITALHDPSGQLRGFAKVTRDVSERRQAEETRLAMYEQREKLLVAEAEKRQIEASFQAEQETNRAKDEFLMTLSHELRTPMTAIIGWSRLLPGMGPEDPLFAEAVASIGRSAELQSRLIDDVLDLSRIIAGKLELLREPVDLGLLVRASAEALRARAAEKSITISTSVDPGLEPVPADPMRLQQVMANLLTNAIKFTPAEGRVDVTAQQNGDSVEIVVRDSGEGIAPEFLEHVFEPFRQGENPRTRIHGGLGLGLSIVRRLVEAHDGTIRAESAGRGQGATFTVSLPARGKTDSQSVVPQLEPRRATRKRPLAGLDILLVEDESDTRSFIRAALQIAGATVVACGSAPAALDAFDERPPALVITDIAMPEMDGFELARMLRGRAGDRDLKIMALSAFPATADQDHDDFDAYLTKPIEPDELIDAVADIAGRH